MTYSVHLKLCFSLSSPVISLTRQTSNHLAGARNSAEQCFVASVLIGHFDSSDPLFVEITATGRLENFDSGAQWVNGYLKWYFSPNLQLVTCLCFA